MTIQISPRTIKLAKISISLIFLFTLLGIVPSAQAGGGISGQPYAILAETMAPEASDIKYVNVTGYLVTTGNSLYQTGYIGQVNLPNGSTIVGVAAYGIDGDPLNDFNYCLYRYNLYNNPVWGLVTPCIASNSVTPDSSKRVYLYSPADAPLATVDNANYSYGVFLKLPMASVAVDPYNPTLAVLRFVVYWNYPVYLPSVTK